MNIITVIFRYSTFLSVGLATLLAIASSARAEPTTASPASTTTPPNPYAISPTAPRIAPNPYAVLPDAPVARTVAPAAPSARVDEAEAPSQPSLSVLQPAVPHDRDMASLAAHAATRPAPASDDEAIVALDEALAGPRMEQAPVASADPGVPTRAQVMEAIAYVSPYIRQCVERQAGRVVHIRTRFASSGRVASAIVEVSAAPISPRERSCMARAARHARTPAFDSERFDVTYPVVL